MNFTRTTTIQWLQLMLLVLVGALGAACNDADRTPGGVTASPSPGMSPSMSPTMSPGMSGTATPATMSVPITDLNMVYQQSDRAMLADRTVQLTGVPVQRVINDRFFWVGTGANQRILVMSNTALTGANRPQVGQSVDLAGTMQRMPASGDMPANWNLPTSAAAEVRQEQVYIMAQRVGMAQR